MNNHLITKGYMGHGTQCTVRSLGNTSLWFCLYLNYYWCKSPRTLYRVPLIILASLFLSLISCDDSDKYIAPEPDPIIPEQETLSVYVNCEGLLSNNNSKLAYYTFKNELLEKDYFQVKNNRRLGDTSNDLKLYGGKLYCVVSASNTLEIINAFTGISIKQLSLTNKGLGRQPRCIDFHESKAYLCCFDGTVVRIDTTSLEIEASVLCGRNPDGICITNNKIYVSNSGGLDFPGYDHTVSVIDIPSFKEIKKIEVASNPTQIHADSEGDVYLVSQGDYATSPYVFQRIDSKEDKLAQTFPDINALKFTVFRDTAYLYNYDFNLHTSWIKVFDCKTETIIRNNFISDGTIIDTPFGINVNPANGDVYITNAYNFQIQGDLLCFDRNGKLKFRINQIGPNPNATVFINF